MLESQTSRAAFIFLKHKKFDLKIPSRTSRSSVFYQRFGIQHGDQRTVGGDGEPSISKWDPAAAR